MLHNQRKPQKVRKAYACAAVAKMMGVTFFYFTYEDVDFSNRFIHGKVYKDGNWVEEKMPFPDALFNAGSPRTKKERKINQRLKKEIPFTSHSIGNKYSVYKRMVESELFTELLIPSFEIEDPTEVMELIKEYKKIIIKPKKGSKGRELIYMEVENSNSIVWTEKVKEVVLSIEEVTEMLKERFSKKSFILQPFITCKTKHNHPFDFRIHVQKNGEGKWAINAIYPRVGQIGGIVSNIHSGGYRVDLEDFLQEEFSNKGLRILSQLKELALDFPEKFERLYDKSFDELGIDVAIENGHQFKLFEVNWRPGCKYRELETAQYHIEYALFLANRSKNGEFTSH